MNIVTTTAGHTAETTGSAAGASRESATVSRQGDRARRRSPRRAARLLAPVLLLAAMLGLAAPAHAAGYYWQGSYAMSTYYGVSTGTGYIGSSGEYFQVYGWIRDARTDGYCSTLQMRGGTPTGGVTSWFNVGSNCSTTTNKMVVGTRYAASGTYFDRIHVRTCQSSSTGAVVGACSAAVAVSGWTRVYV